MPDQRLKDSLTAAAEQYATTVAPAYAYLAGRGIPPETANAYRLGYVAEPRRGHEQFKGMLSIPYLTETGVVAFKFRCIRDHSCKGAGHSKYLIPVGQKTRLYNVNALFTIGEHVAICEGELDAVTLTGLCDIPAVGVPGVSHWQKHYPRLFSGFPTVLVVVDNDAQTGADGRNPGQELARRIIDEIPHATVISLPPGRDVNDLYRMEGRSGLRRRLGIDEKLGPD